MKRKQLASFGSALVLSLSSLLVFGAPKVFAATATWDGEGSDENFSTAANWSGDIIPSTGDDLVFDNTGLTSNQTLNNDLASATFGSITLQGSGDKTFTIGGNAITLTSGVTNTSDDFHNLDLSINLNGNQNIAALNGSLDITGIITGSGNLTKTGTGSVFLEGNNSSYTGAITVSAGSLFASHANALGATSAGTTVVDGAQLVFELISINQLTFTVAEPLTLAGDGDGFIWTDYALGVIGCGGSGCIENADVTLSGPITLTANTQFASNSKVTLTGAINGNYTLAMAKTYNGKIVINSTSNNSATPNGTLTAPAYTTTYSDDQSSIPVTANYNETVILTGKRQDVFVDNGGVLKGTGTAASITVSNGGRIAPGLSPGCLSSGDLVFNSGSTYDFEVGGATVCSEYDQIKVTGTVNLGNGTLNTTLYNNFKPVANQDYTIISNDGTDAVTGTFNNLAEGATFTVNGYVFKVTYKGGDGNDVVLNVQGVPTTPNTGFSLISSHPMQVFLFTTCLAGVLSLMAKRYNSLLSK